MMNTVKGVMKDIKKCTGDSFLDFIKNDIYKYVFSLFKKK